MSEEEEREKEPSERAPLKTPAKTAFAWKKWMFALIPAIGVLELLTHVKQITSVPSEADWKAARAAVEGKVRPSDLVIFAPGWSEPLGRQYFGDGLASLERIARPDETRFPRAIEVSMRGAHRSELSAWKKIDSGSVGPFTISTFENPSPVTLKDDLVTHVAPGGMTVFRVEGDRETECPWTHGGSQTGGIGFGAGIPGDKFSCSGGFVGITVLSDPTYTHRKCIYSPPLGGTTILRIRFANVAFGKSLHGHHSISVESDHTNGAPVTLVFRTNEMAIGKIIRRDGTGWTPFELDTSELEGKKGELIAEITAGNTNRRQYCFEADTR